MNEWRKWKIEEIEKDDADFPKNLKAIKSCPEKIYFRGKWNKDVFNKTISVVGSRRMTKYGRDILEKFIPELVTQKITIISGFMYGVDTKAHQICVDYKGRTIAVLGGGLDYLAPPENDKLYTEILENNGLIVSEYESDFKPTLWSFPQRNRIVSALSTIGILIIEASLKSGSLITAKIGRQQGKEVMAIPGPINFSVSEGTNWLIKSNLAKMITQIEDITKNKKIDSIQESLFDLNSNELKIINFLKNEELTIDELSCVMEISINELSSALSILTLKNIIEEEAGKLYLCPNNF